MKIIERGETLTIRHVPYVKWTLGAFFLPVFGGFLVFMLNAARTRPAEFFDLTDPSLYERAMNILVFLMVVAFVIGMICLFVSMILVPLHETVIDRTERLITVRRRNLLGINGARYQFSQVSGFEVERAGDEKRASFVALRLVNGDLVRIETDPGEDPADVIDRLNSFLKPGSQATAA